MIEELEGTYPVIWQWPTRRQWVNIEALARHFSLLVISKLERV